MQQIFALIDANNFFVSCERLFRPDLVGKPVIVRSSNDGCVVARSNEAKALGVPMGVPVFKIRHLIKEHSIKEFSGSFELYGDISYRMTEVLRTICPRIEVYSVDESFLDISELPIKNYEAWGKWVKDQLWRAVGIPVSIGIAPTKTLAKLAADQAKQGSRGILSLSDKSSKQLDHMLTKTPLKDIWGIGWRLTPKLRAEGLITARDIKYLAPRRAQQLMGIHGRQLVAELNGTICLPIAQEERVHKSLARTRMFGADTNQIHVLEAALASLGMSACVKLRREGLVAYRAGFFLTTNRHKPGYRRSYAEVSFDLPTADTGTIVSTLVTELARVFSPTAFYHRAGVMLYDLAPAGQIQTDLLGFVNLDQHNLSQQRMQAIDAINHRFGKSKIHYAAEDLSQAWRPRQALRSPGYTTDWSELPEATMRN